MFPELQQRHFFSRRLAVMTALSVAAICGNGSDAAVFTYSLSSDPSIQNSATLSGSITVDTGTTNPDVHGGYFVSVTAVTAWDFSVTNATGGFSICRARGPAELV